MKTKTTRYTVRVQSTRSMDLGGFLDMLRYDQARVQTWNRDGDDYLVTLESERFTPERWQSFGIRPEVAA